MRGRPLFFRRFTEGGRLVLLTAKDEARLLNRDAVRPEHIFLGLVAHPRRVAGSVLSQMGVTLDAARRQVETLSGRGTQPVGDREQRFPPETKQLFHLMMKEARRLGHNALGTEHMLLALFQLDDDDGPIAELLRQFRLSEDRTRELVLRELAARQTVPAPEGARNNVLMCRVTTQDLEAIDTLVEAGVRATRSEAAAWLIRAGIEGNRQLFERLQATVEEIRRLREQAQTITRKAFGGSSPPAGEGNLRSAGEAPPGP